MAALDADLRGTNVVPLVAAVTQVAGVVADDPCVACRAGYGDWCGCVVPPAGHGHVTGWACANCERRGARESCSLFLRTEQLDRLKAAESWRQEQLRNRPQPAVASPPTLAPPRHALPARPPSFAPTLTSPAPWIAGHHAGGGGFVPPPPTEPAPPPPPGPPPAETEGNSFYYSSAAPSAATPQNCGFGANNSTYPAGGGASSHASAQYYAGHLWNTGFGFGATNAYQPAAHAAPTPAYPTHGYGNRIQGPPPVFTAHHHSLPPNPFASNQTHNPPPQGQPIRAPPANTVRPGSQQGGNRGRRDRHGKKQCAPSLGPGVVAVAPAIHYNQGHNSNGTGPANANGVPGPRRAGRRPRPNARNQRTAPSETAPANAETPSVQERETPQAATDPIPPATVPLPAATPEPTGTRTRSRGNTPGNDGSNSRQRQDAAAASAADQDKTDDTESEEHVTNYSEPYAQPDLGLLRPLAFLDAYFEEHESLMSMEELCRELERI